MSFRLRVRTSLGDVRDVDEVARQVVLQFDSAEVAGQFATALAKAADAGHREVGIPVAMTLESVEDLRDTVADELLNREMDKAD